MTMSTVRRGAMLLVLVMVCATVVRAADVAGKWRGEFTGPDGSQAHNIFTFAVDGEKLTGTVYSSFSQADAKIEDGSIKGDDIAFAVTRNFQGTDVKLRYTGKVAGDEIAITMSVDAGGQNFDVKMTAKRQK